MTYDTESRCKDTRLDRERWRRDMPPRRIVMAQVDQRKALRAGVGLRAYDEMRACPGYTLFAPMSGGGTVYLIDLHGAVVHTWRMPWSPGLYGHLTPAGTLFYCGK